MSIQSEIDRIVGQVSRQSDLISQVKETLLSKSTENDFIALDYIESNGNQYIDTGVKLNQSSKLEMLISHFDTNGNRRVFGSRTSATSNNFSVISGPVGGTMSIVTDFHNYSNNRLAYVVNGDEFIKISISNTLLKINDLEKSITTYSNFTTSGNAYIFTGSGSYPSGYTNAAMRLHSCKIYDDDVLVRDFIPCIRKDNDEVCLYDKVSKSFFVNAGTGAFEAGSTSPIEINSDELREVLTIAENMVDTFDATATASDILSGKTAYVNGEKITGTYVDSGSSSTFTIVNNTEWDISYGTFLIPPFEHATVPMMQSWCLLFGIPMYWREEDTEDVIVHISEMFDWNEMAVITDIETTYSIDFLVTSGRTRGIIDVTHMSDCEYIPNSTITISPLGNDEGGGDEALPEIGDIITFTIAGQSFQAEYGMTWSDWASTDYNTDGMVFFPTSPFSAVVYFVTTNATIINAEGVNVSKYETIQPIDYQINISI